jgi:bifunctional DNA-binding transcriptional regulator/antitoxin component of YhaV-PrlF toxin-antitoxin module
LKLQKHFAYKYKDKQHYKHVLVLPEETINKLGWNSGVELEQATNGNALVLKPVQASTKEKRFSKVEAQSRKRA